jgi:hypothetical protein
MNHESSPDRRSSHPDNRPMSASSRPDLSFPEFGMRPRLHVVLTPEEQRCFANWSRGVVASVVLLAVATVAVSLFQREATTPLSVVAEQQR